MTRGPKPLGPPEPIGPNLGSLTHEAAAEEAAVKNMERAYGSDRDDANRLYGQFLVVGAMRKFSAAAEIKVLVDIRDRKLFRHLLVIEDNGILRPAENFSEFCEKVLDIAAATIYERIQNYQMLGDAYDDFKRLGFGRRHFRMIGKMPEDERAEVILKGQQVDLSDPDEVTAFFDKLEAEKDKLRKENQNLEADLEAQRQVSAKRNEKIDKLEAALHRRANLPAEEQERELIERLNSAALDVGGAFIALERAIKDVMDREDAPKASTTACQHALIQSVERVWEIAQRQLAGVGIDLHDLLQAISPDWEREILAQRPEAK